MTSFRVMAISTETAQEVRSSMKAPRYGFPAHTELAADQAPCRHCLRLTKPGEDERILFTYDCFDGVEPLPLPGPAYIHAEPCERYDELPAFRRRFVRAR